MARSSRGSSRPASRPSGPTTQQRGTHTAAYPNHPPAQVPAQAQAQSQGRQPGLLAQAASTMGGAVAGSVVGHGISNMLFGGRNHEVAPPPPAEYAEQVRQSTGNCDIAAKDFTKCLEATNGDMGSCGYYLEALSE
ncbi:hypothetical protein M231_07279 [Tremella mesenterica]|uniref:CHCH domain-containing protein n=1 Tax=Tremella mesenterica TaxID=5217 RepID=A0A4Q1BBL7_TREME|nr:hypothetical protein M231_07279 [Tremella mesenterica]